MMICGNVKSPVMRNSQHVVVARERKELNSSRKIKSFENENNDGRQ